jgi:centrosomal protein CEP104
MQIASKVELHVGVLNGEDAVVWRRLGSFSFDSNERSNLQARELKSVTVNAQALFIRIVLARCHTNNQNVYRQVSWITIQLCRSSIHAASSSACQGP